MTERNLRQRERDNKQKKKGDKRDRGAQEVLMKRRESCQHFDHELY